MTAKFPAKDDRMISLAWFIPYKKPKGISPLEFKLHKHEQAAETLILLSNKPNPRLLPPVLHRFANPKSSAFSLDTNFLCSLFHKCMYESYDYIFPLRILQEYSVSFDPRDFFSAGGRRPFFSPRSRACPRAQCHLHRRKHTSLVSSERRRRRR
jgi:hypothetical protein